MKAAYDKISKELVLAIHFKKEELTSEYVCPFCHGPVHYVHGYDGRRVDVDIYTHRTPAHWNHDKKTADKECPYYTIEHSSSLKSIVGLYETSDKVQRNALKLTFEEEMEKLLDLDGRKSLYKFKFLSMQEDLEDANYHTIHDYHKYFRRLYNAELDHYKKDMIGRIWKDFLLSKWVAIIIEKNMIIKKSWKDGFILEDTIYFERIGWPIIKLSDVLEKYPNIFERKFKKLEVKKRKLAWATKNKRRIEYERKLEEENERERIKEERKKAENERKLIKERERKELKIRRQKIKNRMDNLKVLYGDDLIEWYESSEKTEKQMKKMLRILIEYKSFNPSVTFLDDVAELVLKEVYKGRFGYGKNKYFPNAKF